MVASIFTDPGWERLALKYTLLNHRGDSFSNRDLRGRWHLVSLGFTSCPDTCAPTLSQFSLLVSKLGDRADNLEILFYTVDYRRDTADQLAAYLPFFNEDFFGLTHLVSEARHHVYLLLSPSYFILHCC